MTVANAYLELVGYNHVGGSAAAEVTSVEAYNQGPQFSVPVGSGPSLAAHYLTVISQAVTVDGGKTGQYDLRFLASAEGGSHARVGYAIDGVYSPDASNSNIGDALQGVGALGGAWQ